MPLWLGWLIVAVFVAGIIWVAKLAFGYSWRRAAWVFAGMLLVEAFIALGSHRGQ